MDKIAAFFDNVSLMLDALVNRDEGRALRNRSGEMITLLPPLPKPPVKAPVQQPRAARA